ncbi:MAG: sigma-54-dependent Fis family transcriptional regulator [Myxococcaceae bacterium]|nr:sigma-54-dependent Fis family transcriptional regulator [Myxococcaceae bacterium]
MTSATAKKTMICSTTSVMNEVMKSARRIAPSEATVLITGETGTGKEVMARFIHDHSSRAARPFVPMNCGAIPEALLESELFGHVRGAFTGAVAARKGRLALADGGTLFLDEVGELPLSLQVKLLRVLQERVFEPVGSSESVACNFRLVAATNRNLEAEVEAGRFRRDLYYRLMVCPIELPALRERADDIGVLFMHFWRERGETRPFEQAALETLMRYPWPGNVRELENVVERLSVLAEGPVVRAIDLPAQLRNPPRPSMPSAPLAALSLSEIRPPAPTPPGASEVVVLPPVVFDPPVLTVVPPPPSQPTLVVPAAAPMPLPMPPPPPFPVASAEPTGTVIVGAFGADAPVVLPRPTPPANFPLDLPTLLRRIEDELIDAALQQAQGNKKAAADLLGLQRTTLVEKLRRRSPRPTPPQLIASEG